MLFTKIFEDIQFPTGGVTPPPVPPPLPPEVELPPQKIYILLVMLQPPVLLPLVPFPVPPVELFKISRISLTVVLVETEVFKILLAVF